MEVVGNSRHRQREQLCVIRLVNPAARAGGVRQGDCNCRSPCMLHDVVPADQPLQRNSAQKPCDGQFADGDDQRGSNDAEFIVQPRGTTSALGRRRHPITPS